MAKSTENGRLVVVAGPQQGNEFTLAGSEVTIGRRTSCTVRLADLAISREHCVLRRGETGYSIQDLGSFNGTFVNGSSIKLHQLRHGDQIAVGDTVFAFLADREEPGAVLAGGLHQSTVRMRAAPDSTEGFEHRLGRDTVRLIEIGRGLTSTSNVDTIERELLERVLELVSADCAALAWRRSGTSGEFDFRTVGNFEVPVTGWIADRVIESGDAMLVDEPFQAAGRAVYGVLAVPLIAAQSPGGCIYVCSLDSQRRFSETDLALVCGVAQVAAPALANCRRFAALLDENGQLRAQARSKYSMFGESEAVRLLQAQIGRVAPRDTTVLITGESGTGKELAARAIHSGSNRADRQFMAINCATLTEHLLESELFGHEKGAFTGAFTQKKGKIELAQGGTLFLDEVGELAPGLQAKLLRVLQERQFERVGGSKILAADVRVIAATNRNLAHEISGGKFREDLYFRLNVVHLKMPPLRERGGDIRLLATFFAARHADRCGRRIGGISEDTMTLLEHYDWPGNVRELENAIERAIVLGESDMLRPEDLPESIAEFHRADDASVNPYLRGVTEARKRAVLAAFRQTGGRYTEAAKILDMNPNYLHRLVNRLDLRDPIREITAQASA